MDTMVEAVLAEYEERQQKEIRLVKELGPQALARRDEFLLAIGHDAGLLLNHLIKTNGCKSILEVGTSYGASAIWLGEAARANGGKLITLEIAAKKVDYARAMAAKAGLQDSIEFVVGDAVASIEALPGPFDFVLIDLWKDLYVPVFDALYEKLAPGAFVVADNMILPAEWHKEVTAYQRHVRSKPDMGSVLLRTGSGLEFSQKMTAIAQ